MEKWCFLTVYEWDNMILEFFDLAIVITANELHPEFCKLMIKQFLGFK